MKIDKYDVIVRKLAFSISNLSSLLERYVFEDIPKKNFMYGVNSEIENLIELNSCIISMEEEYAVNSELENLNN